MNVDLTNKKVQFLLGLSVNLIYLIILLLSSHTSFVNLQVPEDNYKENLWQCTDFLTYYEPAKNFLQTGIFGYGLSPDYVRPMGYQIFIALLIVLFGKGWIYAAYLIQSALFALIYPLITGIIEQITSPKKSYIKFVFLLSMITGIYFTRAIYIGPDLMLTFLFITGVYFTILCIRKQKWKYGIWAFLIISYAAQVRPTFIIYPFIHVGVVLFLAKKFDVLHSRFTRIFLISSSLFLLFTCNLASIRNYINYGIFKPTIILKANYYDYLAKKVLFKENQTDYFYRTKARMESFSNLKVQLELKKEKALEVFREYPKTTIKVLIENLQCVLFDNQLVNFTGNLYGYNWKAYTATKGCYTLKPSKLLYVLYLFYAFLYLIIYVMFFLSLYRLFQEKKYMHIISVLLIIFIFLIPSVIIGDGGARFRLPFEWIIIIVACRVIFFEKAKWKFFLSSREKI